MRSPLSLRCPQQRLKDSVLDAVDLSSLKNTTRIRSSRTCQLCWNSARQQGDPLGGLCPTLLDASEQDAHEALYEMEMAALEAQRVAEATEAALEDSDDDLEPLRIADTAAQQEVSIDRLLGLAFRLLKIGKPSLASLSIWTPV